jgi:hypothetical protein
MFPDRCAKVALPNPRQVNKRAGEKSVRSFIELQWY